MNWLKSRYTWGLLLIALGILLLAQTIGLLPESVYLWVAVFLFGSVVCFGIMFSSQEHWWAAFPAFPLLGVGVLILLSEIAPSVENAWGGSLILGMVGLSFFVVYLRNRSSNWWAIIPGGVMASLALIVGLDEMPIGSGIGETGGILFLGLGLTFGLLYILPHSAGKQRWAIWPAGGLLVFGTLVTAAATDLLRFLGPILLILLGVYWLLKSFRR